MPKMKTNRSAAKRFYKTGSGKLMRRQGFKSHLLSHKSSKRKRRLHQDVQVFYGEAPRLKKLVPYI